MPAKLLNIAWGRTPRQYRSQDIILGMNVIWPLGRRGGAEALTSKKRKGNNQQDTEEACYLPGANFVDSIENNFDNREEFKYPHNPSSSEENMRMGAIEDQDQFTCTISSGSDGPHPANKALPSFPAYCPSANCRYRLREVYWRRLKLDGLEKKDKNRGLRSGGRARNRGLMGHSVRLFPPMA